MPLLDWLQLDRAFEAEAAEQPRQVRVRSQELHVVRSRFAALRLRRTSDGAAAAVRRVS
jgi:hypothetical protein